ncbi:MAG: hypothetical protein HQL52_14600 [Magnetococcales bacterium]|nr:hypothetical protein [Magnetococcales bacterium]
MSHNPRYREIDLPDSLLEIKDAIGLEGAMTLVKSCGGTRLFIPKRIRAQHKLAQLLGIERARRLSLRFGGETLMIVRAVKAMRQARNREIIRRYDAGIPVRTLAQEYDLTERAIYAILSAVPN